MNHLSCPCDDPRADDVRRMEKAADPADYLSLRREDIPLAGGALRVSSARRTGLSHLRHGLPCQDHCLFRAIPHGAALAIADGISACESGGEGAQIACETALDMIEDESRAAADENALVQRLCSADFHHALRAEWVRRIAARHPAHPAEDVQSLLYSYGTTLAFAAVTENYYAAFGIGDGQILFFNSTDCMKLRLVGKAGPAPGSLIYPDYIQQIHCGAFPRDCFDGVLLLTDGMNDALELLSADAPHRFCLQAARRAAGDDFAPPFLYEGDLPGDMRAADLSRQLGAFDDCSMLLALNPAPARALPEKIHAQIRSALPQAESVELLRLTGECACHLVSAPEGYLMTLALPESQARPLRDPRLTHFRGGAARLLKPCLLCTGDGLRLAAYPLPHGAMSLLLEEAQQSGCFRPDEAPGPGELPRFTAQAAAEACRTLRHLRAHLLRQGLRLRPGAENWILRLQDDARTLLIPSDALTECENPTADLPWSPGAERFFPGLIGWIECADACEPLFDSEIDPRGEGFVHYLGKASGDCFFLLRRNAGENLWGIANCGEADWEFVNFAGCPTRVPPGSTLTLSDGLRFRVSGAAGYPPCTVRML